MSLHVACNISPHYTLSTQPDVMYTSVRLPMSDNNEYKILCAYVMSFEPYHVLLVLQGQLWFEAITFWDVLPMHPCMLRY